MVLLYFVISDTLHCFSGLSNGATAANGPQVIVSQPDESTEQQVILLSCGISQ